MDGGVWLHRHVIHDEPKIHLGTTPRYEPATNPTCETHHRKLPCKRCL